MNIAYIGNFKPAHSTENQYARSFEALGHAVWALQENAPETWGSLITGYPDLVLYTRTWGLDQYAQGQLVDARSKGVPTAAVHLDRWFSLAREHELTEQTMFKLDHVFTADGDNQKKFEALGINHHWLRPGVVEDECYDAKPNPEWEGRWDVAFVGSAPTPRGGNYHPEWPHRAELVRWLEATYGDRFVHVGNGGHLGNNQPEPNYRGDTINRFYASVPVIVGDSCFARPTGHYWSERVYETWGRGGFLIHPRIAALTDEIGVYPSWDVGELGQLRDEIDLWLGDPEQREKVRKAIANNVRRHSTYTQRAAEMLQVMGLA